MKNELEVNLDHEVKIDTEVGLETETFGELEAEGAEIEFDQGLELNNEIE